MNKRSELLFTPTQKLSEWLEVINDAVVRCGDVYALSDTETTSVHLSEIKGDVQYNHRILEYAFLFYVYDSEAQKLVPLADSDGEHIYFHELCNFFAETEEFRTKRFSIKSIPEDGVHVHGITEGYLLSEDKSPKKRPKLGRMAMPFGETFPVALRMFQTEAVFERESPIKLVFHNSFFDTGFFNSELRMHGMPPIESYALIVDTLVESQRIIPGLENYKLDNLYALACEFYNEKPLPRPFHDAKTDSEMLAPVLSMLLAKR
jgi:DNA polymerase III epsilon subunit-like protein